jgi:hypothetical protein
METAGDYIIQMISKVLREDVKSVCIKQSSVDAFCAYSDAWMPRSICERISIVCLVLMFLT